MSKEPTQESFSARERILHTAHDLFYRDGIRATGINLIIAESGVSKVTFYRHFPSKNDLIHAYLAYRHQRWMTWFTQAIEQHGGNIDAIVPAMGDWLRDKNFRGCTFINSVGELAGELPEIRNIAKSHKLEMMDVIAKLIPPSPTWQLDTQAIGLAIDGAIIRAQFDDSPEAALQALARVVQVISTNT